MEWKMPINHFNFVNEQGHLSYWEQIGTLDLGDDLQLPLIIGFKSSRETVSDLLGQSWLMPLLESHFIQLDDQWFQMVQPDGLNQKFLREKATDTTLKGGGGWMAEIQGDIINAWAVCGWKLTYHKGKLVSITTPKSKTINLEYSGGRVTEVKEGGTTVLKVDLNPNTNQVVGITAGEKSYKFEQDRKPRVQVINGQNLIGGMDLSLHKLTFPNGHFKTYEFAVDQKLQPTLKITENGTERNFAWNPINRLILSDNDWTYKITPDEKNPNNNAAIGRKNAKGQEEFWHYDRAKGIEVVQDIFGKKRTATWFVSGILAGKPRKVEESTNGKIQAMEQSFYDEKASLIRKKVIKNEELIDTEYIRNDKGLILQEIRNGKTLVNNEYDGTGRLVKVLYPDGKISQYYYNADGSIEKTGIDKNNRKTVEIIKENNLLKRITPEGEIVEYHYSSRGVLLSEERSLSSLKTKLEYSYGVDGRFVSIKKNKMPYIDFFTTQKNQKIQAYYADDGSMEKVWNISLDKEYLGLDGLDYLRKEHIKN